MINIVEIIRRFLLCLRILKSINHFFDNIFYFGTDLIRHLENSWADEFRKHSLPILIEAQKDFAPLYSDKLNTRPSTPTFLVLGYMVLKSLFVLTDEDLISEFVQMLRFSMPGAL